MRTLALSAQIETTEGWLELEDPENGYSLHKDSFSQQQVTRRKQEIEGEWVEGSFTTRSVRNNVTETLAVWVEGATPWEARQRRERLLNALGQLSYQFKLKDEDELQTWDCQPADYSLEAGQELRFARLVLVRAQVPRLPEVLYTQVAP